jgi:hypothetical protein
LAVGDHDNRLGFGDAIQIVRTDLAKGRRSEVSQGVQPLMLGVSLGSSAIPFGGVAGTAVLLVGGVLPAGRNILNANTPDARCDLSDDGLHDVTRGHWFRDLQRRRQVARRDDLPRAPTPPTTFFIHELLCCPRYVR